MNELGGPIEIELNIARGCVRVKIVHGDRGTSRHERHVRVANSFGQTNHGVPERVWTNLEYLAGAICKDAVDLACSVSC